MEFHVSSDIILPEFFPNPQTPQECLLYILDVKWATPALLRQSGTVGSSYHMLPLRRAGESPHNVFLSGLLKP